MRFITLAIFLALALAGAASAKQSGASKLPRNGLIAYDSDVAGPIQIYVMNPDGSAKRRLTRSRPLNAEPSWSPDGRRIAFVHGGCSTTGCSPATRSALWIMNADGSGQRHLTTGGSVDYNPRWSPDGRSIAFTHNTSCTDNGCKSDIRVIRPDGSGARPLTQDGRSAEPAWSPDGKQLAFARGSANGHRADLYVMNADGTGERNLTANVNVASLDVSDPAWSPDGRTIVFAPFGIASQTLAFIKPDGTAVGSMHPFAGDLVSEPAWSPDGKSLVVQTQQTLWVLPFRRPGRAKRVAFNGDNHDPDWQPRPRRR